MRQLLVQVPHGHGSAALDIARSHNGTNLARWDATGDEGSLDLVVIHVSNDRVGNLVEDLERLPNLRVTLIPRGLITLHPPHSAAPRQVTDVTERSPIEIFLAGLQSVGSWRGLLGYAAAAGAVVWIGLFTNASYLLTAAMLIAPFAGPAMNAAIATARGDGDLLRQSLGQYFAGLAVTAAVAAALTLGFSQEIATRQMAAASEISSAAVLLFAGSPAE